MKLRYLTAALALAAVALVSTAGVATAQDSSSTAPTTAASNAPTNGKAAACAKATARLPKIQDRETNVQARITKLNARLAKAQQGNHPDAVKVIQFRLDWAQKLDQHLKDASALITSECPTS
jgi:hypothetical protein